MLRYKIILLLLVSTLAFGQWYSPQFIGAYGKYRSALIGGEIKTGVALRFTDILDLSAGLWTYQSQADWQSWSGQVRTDTRLFPCSILRIIALGGIKGDFVDLTGRTTSPSLARIAKTSQYKPNFAVGAGIDSLKFICKRCNYYFTGEVLIGDFVPFPYSFSNANMHGETLSTTFVISAETATPFGIAGVFRQARMRQWFGDDIWRITYTSPFCCKGLLRCSAGWESGYLGFASTEINFQPVSKKYPMSLIFGVELPQDASLWQWNIALQFHPYISGKGRRCNRSSGGSTSRDIQILAPNLEDPYQQ